MIWAPSNEGKSLEQLEEEEAAFFGAESALFFSSGFAANSVLLSTLPQRGDLIVHDALLRRTGFVQTGSLIPSVRLSFETDFTVLSH